MWMYSERRAEKRVRGDEGIGGAGATDAPLGVDESNVGLLSDLRRGGIGGLVDVAVPAGTN